MEPTVALVLLVISFVALSRKRPTLRPDVLPSPANPPDDANPLHDANPSRDATPRDRPRASRAFKVGIVAMCTSTTLGLVNFIVFIHGVNTFAHPFDLFDFLGGVQCVAAAIAVVGGLVAAIRDRHWRVEGAVLAIGATVFGFVAFVAVAVGRAFLDPNTKIDVIGPPWGRPLRLRGRVLHPALRLGSNWTRGASADLRGVDPATRAALEQIWLHDAQKEHASVPAFARISWMLAAVGAPADLVAWSHRAALEEVDHARRCFALAAGYGGREHTVEPMPDLLLGGLDVEGDPLVHLATESLRDGCLLEDFNADVAAACADACEDANVRAVLEQIAREERSHAEFSWALVAWLADRGGAALREALVASAATLHQVPRPSAVAPEIAAIVASADPRLLRIHGRVPDEQWAALWAVRLPATKARLGRLVVETRALAA